MKKFEHLEKGDILVRTASFAGRGGYINVTRLLHSEWIPQGMTYIILNIDVDERKRTVIYTQDCVGKMRRWVVESTSDFVHFFQDYFDVI